jgi:hypothetical protein
MFVELPEFTRRVVRLGLEDDLRELQNYLESNPKAGNLDPGTCGLRKVRITDAAHGRGKRGGARVHYFYYPARQIIYLIWIYTKAEQGTLSPEQKRMLCRWVRSLDADEEVSNA